MANTTRSTGQLDLLFDSGRRVLSVTELNAAVQRLFEIQFRSIWVVGEISGCRQASSGHYYFSLKDSQSQIRCALFKGSARYVKFKPQEGLAVIARGSLEVYEARGEYQLIVETLEPQGAGALQIAFEQLKKKLTAEGLFEALRKRPLPRLPRRIGLITSPAGAVIRDMLHVLERRFRGLHIRLYPAQVQGEYACEQVCRALEFFSASGWAEVVILARGGGSLEDLWTFNEEDVVRAIAACTVPVISAIGHETDFTLADFVADCRAPTPSAAAEIVICTRESLLEQLSGCRARLTQAMRYRLMAASRDLHQRGTERAATLIHRVLARRGQRVDELEYHLRALTRRTLEVRHRQLADLIKRLQATDLRLRFSRARRVEEQLRERLQRAMQSKLWDLRRRQELNGAHLRQISPLTVLARGYAIVETADHRVLRSASEASIGETLRLTLNEGQLDAAVLSRIEDGQ